MLSALTQIQIILLLKIKDNSYSTITQIIATISDENRMPKSSLRSNAARLRRMGLIDCGTDGNRGIPAILTDSGEEAVRLLKDSKIR